MSLRSKSFLSLIITTQRKLIWVFLQQQLFTSLRETPIKTSFLSLCIFTFVLSTYQDDCRESDIGPHPVGNPLPLPPLAEPNPVELFFSCSSQQASNVHFQQTCILWLTQGSRENFLFFLNSFFFYFYSFSSYYNFSSWFGVLVKLSFFNSWFLFLFLIVTVFHGFSN